MSKRCFSHLRWKDRLRIEQMLRDGYKATKIADTLHVHNSTIYREIKRGMTTQLTTDLEYVSIYCADTAQRKYEEFLAAKGCDLKIGNDYELANYLERKIRDEHYSPAAALAAIKEEGKSFSVEISEWTLYSYIARGVFATLTNKDLPRRGKGKSNYHKVRECRLPRGTSIEDRPPEVTERCVPGDWEMDSVISGKGCLRRLVVMTERVTRDELIFLAPDGTSDSVIKILDKLERKIGTETFTKVFRTITVDNGSEFANSKGMQRSCLRKGDRTQVFYCHPYSSYERGSNENCNLLIRRWLPKGTSFKSLTHAHVKAIEHWINNYPREILGYRSAGNMFREYLQDAGLHRAMAIL